MVANSEIDNWLMMPMKIPRVRTMAYFIERAQNLLKDSLRFSLFTFFQFSQSCSHASLSSSLISFASFSSILSSVEMATFILHPRCLLFKSNKKHVNHRSQLTYL